MKPNDVLEIISLETACRKRASYTIILDNPTSVPLQITPYCTSPYIKLPVNFTLPAECKVNIPITYCPLIKEEVTGVELRFKHLPIVGTYEYLLNLTGLAENENEIYFEVDLGKTLTLPATVANVTKKKCEFHIEVIMIQS